MRARGTLTIFTKGDRGDGLVEFAVVAVVLLTCIVGILDCSRALYAYHFCSYAAREAARYAIVRGSTWGATACSASRSTNCNASTMDIQTYVQSIVPQGIDSGAALSVSTIWPGTELAGAATTCTTVHGSNSPGCLVQVQISYSFNYVSPLLPSSTLRFTSSSAAVIIQ